MKILIWIGIFLLLGNTTVAKIGIWAWMFQSSVILLLGAGALFVVEKRLTTGHSIIWKSIGMVSFGLMLLLTIWGFLNGMWDAHPFGFIIALAGCIWVFYCGVKSRKSSITKDVTRNKNESRTVKDTDTVRNTVILFLIGVGLWIWGDGSGTYNGFLVFLGWVSMVGAFIVYRRGKNTEA